MIWLGPLAALAGRLADAAVRFAPLLLAWFAGRRAERADRLARTVEVQDEQLRHAADRPRDRRDLVERLRSDGL
jgi:uncharacterized membrane protein YccC